MKFNDNGVTMAIGEYIALLEFARVQTLVRPVAPPTTQDVEKIRAEIAEAFGSVITDLRNIIEEGLRNPSGFAHLSLETALERIEEHEKEQE